VSHCFTGTLEEAREYIKLGFYLGFNGLIFKKIEGLPNFEEIIKEIPLEKILVETDCPYLTPPQVGGRNEPLYVKYIAEEIAKIKNISYEEVENKTTQNAKTLFKI
jgi:TatD DNase family protein